MTTKVHIHLGPLFGDAGAAIERVISYGARGGKNGMIGGRLGAHFDSGDAGDRQTIVRRQL